VSSLTNEVICLVELPSPCRWKPELPSETKDMEKEQKQKPGERRNKTSKQTTDIVTSNPSSLGSRCLAQTVGWEGDNRTVIECSAVRPHAN